jgi:hypothetical protein
MSSDMSDVSEAVQKLLRSNIERNLPPAARQDLNQFRSENCYVEAVDTVLRKHEAQVTSRYGYTQRE